MQQDVLQSALARNATRLAFTVQPQQQLMQMLANGWSSLDEN